MAGVKSHRWDHALGFAKKREKRDLASFVVTLYSCRIQGIFGYLQNLAGTNRVIPSPFKCSIEVFVGAH